METEVTAYQQENSKVAAPADLKKRLDEVVKVTALAPMQYIGKRGWFTRPKRGAELKLSTAFGYLFASDPAPKMPAVPKADTWDDAMLSDKERADLTEIRKLEPPAVEFPRTP